MTYYNQALSISLVYPIRKELNPLATKKYAIRYWQLLKNFLIKTRQLCYTYVRLATVCKKCAVVCSNIGLAFITKGKNTCFLRKLSTTKKKTRIMQL